MEVYFSQKHQFIKKEVRWMTDTDTMILVEFVGGGEGIKIERFKIMEGWRSKFSLLLNVHKPENEWSEKI